MIRRHDSLQRRPHDLFGRRRDDVELEVMALDAVAQEPGQQRDVALQADAASDFGQILPAHAPVFGIVAHEVGQLAALLHKVQPREASHLVLETGDAEQLAQRDTGIVETERLIEIACEQIVLHVIPPAPPFRAADAISIRRYSISGNTPL